MTCFNCSRIIGRSIGFNTVSEEKQVTYKMFLPESLRAKFKSLCALNGVSMNQVLIDLVEKWIEENNTPSPAKKGKGD